MYRQALLIQDVKEFRSLVMPSLTQCFIQTEATLLGWTIEDALKWSIEHQIENVYGLSVQGHTRSGVYLARLHGMMKTILPYPLDLLTSHLIKVPQIFDEQMLSVELRGHDLYIGYLINTKLIFNRP